MMSFADPSMALLAACGGDTVKLFDLSMEADRDPCTLSYSPSPGSHVNSVKWNHTNLVVASAGDDKKISLWHKNGKSLGTVPISGNESGENINETISAISFSNKSSRYICSGGSGKVVRIWDLQRKLCIKWLKGHTDTITGAMYNCKDEHLASISKSGDLILHNLASGARATELKDPNGQVLSVLDYSRMSRHLLVTAGDDGSIHLWDSTGRSPKVSWSKQHSAPTTAVSFSPSNDKIIASVGLDKKLYTLDSGSRRSTSCISYEAPFQSLAFRDDGWILAAGTNNGRVVFYDVRGKPQPITSLRAYSNSEAVTSLCWQRSKPNIVNEINCTAEMALLGDAGEDSILMPDPRPSQTPSSLSLAAPRNILRSSLSLDAPSLLPTTEETPNKNHLWTGSTLSRLKAPQTTNYKDDMDVFSPIVDVQPITPSLDKLLDDHDRKPTSMYFPSSMRKSPFLDEGSNNSHPIFDWKSNSTSKQDDTRSSSSVLRSTPTTSSRTDDAQPATPPEAWGGEIPPRYGPLKSEPGISSSMAGLHSSFSFTGQTSMSSLANAGPSFAYLQTKDISSNIEPSWGVAEHGQSSSMPTTSLATRGFTGQANLESSGGAFTRRFSTYAERIGTNPSFSEAVGSPKAKKTGTETREEINMMLRPDTGGLQRGQPQSDMQQSSSSFTLQLVQRTLEENLSSIQKSLHDDIRNLHIELLSQFHTQEMEMSRMMDSVLEKQDELTKEVQSLRKENQQLRQLL